MRRLRVGDAFILRPMSAEGVMDLDAPHPAVCPIILFTGYLYKGDLI